MKTKNSKKMLLMLTLLLCLSFYTSTYAHAEVSYLGEACIWEATPGVMGMPPVLLMKLGILNYGSGHFVLNGSGAPGLDEPISGTGMIDGNTFVATLVSSLVNSTNTSFTVSHLALNFETGGTSTITRMTFDLTQPTAQTKVTPIPIYVTVCGP